MWLHGKMVLGNVSNIDKPTYHFLRSGRPSLKWPGSELRAKWVRLQCIKTQNTLAEKGEKKFTLFKTACSVMALSSLIKEQERSFSSVSHPSKAMLNMSDKIGAPVNILALLNQVHGVEPWSKCRFWVSCGMVPRGCYLCRL